MNEFSVEVGPMRSFAFILAFLFAYHLMLSSVRADEKKSESSKKLREYAGGRDEEDLKVQDEIRTPTLTADRRSLEQRVLKSYLKKSDAEPSAKK